LSRHRYAFTSALIAVVLIVSTACEVFSPAPTLRAPVELITPTPPPTRRPSATPRPIASPTPRPTSTATPTATHTPNPLLPTSMFADSPPQDTLEPVLLTQIAADMTATLMPQEILIGHSVENRRISAHQLGRGAKTILLVGGIHGGWEVNTVTLMNQAIAYFEENPQDIAPGLSLVIVPALNPDGVMRGRIDAGRFNGNGVDLNRNWACDWSSDAMWQDRRVNAGDVPFSEPESAALADYILLNPPRAVIFYHSAADGVFAGACNGDHGSQVLGHIYGAASNYPSDGRFSAYRVTGDASNWVDGQAIPSITVELQNWTDTEWSRNYAGIMAVQCEIVRSNGGTDSRQWASEHCDS
jgi:predicted deacylase